MGVIAYKCRLGINCIVHDIGWLQETSADMISCQYAIGDAAYHFVDLLATFAISSFPRQE